MCMAARRHRPITHRSLVWSVLLCSVCCFLFAHIQLCCHIAGVRFFFNPVQWQGVCISLLFFNYLFLRSSFKVLSSWDVKLCRLCSWHEREFPPKELLFSFFFLFSSGEKFIKSCWSRFPLVQEWKLFLFFPHIHYVYLWFRNKDVSKQHRLAICLFWKP